MWTEAPTVEAIACQQNTMTKDEIDQKLKELREEYRQTANEQDRRILAARGKALQFAKEELQAREGFL